MDSEMWITRNRRVDAQLPHPDGYDEWRDGHPTGRISKMIGGTNVIGTLAEIDAAQAAYDASPPPDLHFHLFRDLKQDQRFRDALSKFETGSHLNDIELRELFQIHGILFQMIEPLGPRYGFVHDEMRHRLDVLVEIARERGWTQSILNMLEVMIKEALARIC